MIGRKFSRLTVLSEAPKDKHNLIRYNCICECGTLKVVYKSNLTSGKSTSCGCFHKEQVKSIKTTHGQSHTLTHNSWNSMVHRCKTDTPGYGRKGISVCESWLNSYENFLNDMGERPSVNYTLDRIDPNGNYEKSNCRWATLSEQAFNQNLSKNNTSGIRGARFLEDRNKWRVGISVNGKGINLGYFNTRDEALRARQSAELKYYGKIVSV